MTDEITFPDIAEFDIERAKLQRRRRIAQSLLQQPLGPQPGEMVGRFYVAPNPGQYINAATQKVLAARDDTRLDEEEAALAKREADMSNKMLSSIPAEGPERLTAQVQAMRFPSLREAIKAQLMGDEAMAKRVEAGEQKAADRLAREQDREDKQEFIRQQNELYKRTAAQLAAVAAGNSRRDRYSVQQGADGKMYRVNLETGEALPIQIAGGEGALTKPLAVDKPLNEAQGNAYLYGTRASEADRILKEVGTDYSPMKLDIAKGAERVPFGSAFINSTMLNPKDQQAMQAQRDFVNAILRKESGAAISQSEFDNARKQYFPQPGDSKEVIDQKTANRETAIRGLSKIAGPSGKDIEVKQPGAPTVVRTGTRNGVRVEQLSDGTIREVK